jgi:nitroreductase
VGDRSVHLYADPSRQLAATDPGARDLLLSCGAALHHLRTAFAALGWASDVHRLPNAAEPNHLAAVELHEHEATQEDIALAAAISRRRTDRRRCSSWQVPPILLSRLAERAAAEGVLMRTATDPVVRFQLISAMAEEALRQHAEPEYAGELAAWSGRHASPEGVPAASIPPIAGRYGDVTMREFGGGELAQPEAASEEDDAGVLLVLGTPSDDRLSRLRAGEATSAVLLAATDFRLATCPLTQPLEIRGVRDLVRVRVLDAATYPHMVLRVGWAPEHAQPPPATPRRPVDEVTNHFPS